MKPFHCYYHHFLRENRCMYIQQIIYLSIMTSSEQVLSEVSGLRVLVWQLLYGLCMPEKIVMNVIRCIVVDIQRFSYLRDMVLKGDFQRFGFLKVQQSVNDRWSNQSCLCAADFPTCTIKIGMCSSVCVCMINSTIGIGSGIR